MHNSGSLISHRFNFKLQYGTSRFGCMCGLTVFLKSLFILSFLLKGLWQSQLIFGAIIKPQLFFFGRNKFSLATLNFSPNMWIRHLSEVGPPPPPAASTEMKLVSNVFLCVAIILKTLIAVSRGHQRSTSPPTFTK